MRTLWRLGYDRSAVVVSLGWRHLVGPFWWYSPRHARELLNAYAKILNVTPWPGESDRSLRERLLSMWREPPR